MNLNDLALFYHNMLRFGFVKAELVSDDEKLIGFQATYADGSVIQHTFATILVKEAEKPKEEEKKEEKSNG